MKLNGFKMICMTALLAGCNSAVDIEQQVDELYAKMPQEERIAQLRSMYMDELFNEQGQLDTAKCRELIPYGIGHFSQFCTATTISRMVFGSRGFWRANCEKWPMP